MSRGWSEIFKPPTPPVRSTLRPTSPGETGSAYAEKAFAEEVARVREATEGHRNATLNAAAFNLATLVGAGMLDGGRVEQAMLDAAYQCGLPESEARATCRSAMTAGVADPRQVELEDPGRLTFNPAGGAGEQSGNGGERWGTVGNSAPGQDLRSNDLTVPPVSSQPAPPGPQVGGAGPGLALVQGDGGTDRERSSWWPVPVLEAAAHAGAAPPPELLFRTDGQPLLYRGRVNGLQGESESGKSWIALLAVQQVAKAGGRVLYLDFEDSASTIRERLELLGLTEWDMARVFYAQPDERLQLNANADLAEAVDAGFDLTVVDGVNAALSLWGFSADSNDDTTAFARAFLHPLARRRSSAVLTVDHVPKHAETRGKGAIGAQAKRAMIDGVSLTVEVVRPFGRGQMGELRLLVDKDKLGHVRGAARQSKKVGLVVLDSTKPGEVRMHIEADQGSDGPALTMPDPLDTGVPLLMERISIALESGELTKRALWQQLGVRKGDEDATEALTRLEAEGYIEVMPGARGAQNHRLVKVFRRYQLEADRALKLSRLAAEDAAQEAASQDVDGSGQVAPTTGDDCSPPFPTVPGEQSGTVERLFPAAGGVPSNGYPPTGERSGFEGNGTVPQSGNGQQAETPGPGLSEWSVTHSACNTCGRDTPNRHIEQYRGLCVQCYRIEQASRR